MKLFEKDRVVLTLAIRNLGFRVATFSFRCRKQIGCQCRELMSQIVLAIAYMHSKSHLSTCRCQMQIGCANAENSCLRLSLPLLTCAANSNFQLADVRCKLVAPMQRTHASDYPCHCLHAQQSFISRGGCGGAACDLVTT